MKFRAVLICCTAVKCQTPQPQPRPQPPPCTIQVYHARRRGNPRNRQHRRMSKLQYEWQPSLATISEDNMSFEVLQKIEVQLESQVKLTKTNNSSPQKASASTYAREIKQGSTFNMTIPTFIPSTFFF